MSTSAPPVRPPPLPPPEQPPRPEKVLRRLYLTLFLRGRSSRGLKKESAPKSVGTKLAWTLFFYALFGCMNLAWLGQSVFTFSTFLHAMTLMFIGMFVASSSGEVLFNQEEADILLHRPVSPRSLLWAKIGVLVQISLWLAFAFNLAGLIGGVAARDGGWLYPVAHILSTVLQTFFCISAVVLLYQLCLRWFGRERLDALMTTAQVLMAIAFVMAGQILPRVAQKMGHRWNLSEETWWIWLLPPAWFAGLDDALAGSRSPLAWLLGGLGVASTLVLAWAVFGRLAQYYGAGLQALAERDGGSPAPSRRRWLDQIIQWPILRPWLGDPISRATIRLVIAYLVRDRDVKLRVYPSLAPPMMMPLLLLLQGRQGAGSFGIAFAGSYLGLVPLLGTSLLQYSQHSQAADLFRAAPLPGPEPLNRGLRRAVLLLLTVPFILIYVAIACLFLKDTIELALFLPGLIALPVYALIPCLKGEAVPLSQPADEAKSAGRGVAMIGAIISASALSLLSTWAWTTGWFSIFLAVEALASGVLFFTLSATAKRARWKSLE